MPSAKFLLGAILSLILGGGAVYYSTIPECSLEKAPGTSTPLSVVNKPEGECCSAPSPTAAKACSAEATKPECSSKVAAKPADCSATKGACDSSAKVVAKDECGSTLKKECSSAATECGSAVKVSAKAKMDSQTAGEATCKKNACETPVNAPAKSEQPKN